MKKIFTITLLYLLLVPYIKSQNNIINGTQLIIEEAPYQVQIYTWAWLPSIPIVGPVFRGSGYLISDRHVLTAAHIVENVYNINTNPTNFELAVDMYVKVGHEILQQSNFLFVNAVIPNANYLPNRLGGVLSDHDIAILELASPISFNHKQMPVEFANSCNTQTMDYAINNEVFVSGWGSVTAGSNNNVNHLNGGITNLISTTLANQLNNTCNPSITPVGSNEIAVLDQNGSVTPYRFDSGSPAVLNKNGNLIGIGTLAWSCKNSQNQTNLPAIYTDVLDYESWLLQNTNLLLPSSSLDLYTKDKPWDQGEEPFNTPDAWTSEDIWVRHNNDNIEQHQNPEFKTSSPNYVYVRVTNNSCVASTGNEQLTLNWAKGATNLTWPAHWDGSISAGTQPLGGAIGTVTLPVIQPGDAHVAVIPWFPPDPALFSPLYAAFPTQFLRDEPHHFCLLSRIVSAADPMTVTETANVYANTRKNNNIAWKNVSVFDLNSTNLAGGSTGDDRPLGANIIVGGMGNENETFDLQFCNTPQAGEANITEFAEVKVTLDDDLWQLWENNNFEASALEVFNDEKQ